MADARIASQTPQIIRREDYRAPDWFVPEIALDFDLDPTAIKDGWVRISGIKR